MKNFDLRVTHDRIYEDSFCISRANQSYNYFESEYNDMPRDIYGNFLLSSISKKKENIFNKIFHSIKENLLSDEKAIGISFGSSEYNYFQSEYNSLLSKDANQNIIVPLDEYPKVKVKKN